MTNSQNKIRAALLLIGSITLIFLTACSSTSSRPVSKTTFVLNTVATITLYDGSDTSVIDSCFDLCREYEAKLSRTAPSSEISLLNERKTDTVSPDTAELIEKGLYYSSLSGGAFDITVQPISSLWDFSSDEPEIPSASALSEAAKKVDYRKVSINGTNVTFSSPDTRLDLGAIAKGFIADKMKDYLVSKGVSSAIIDLGGNILCIGGKTASEGFEVGILYPFQNRSIAGIKISDRSVVTSGVYERCFEKDGTLYHHLLNTKTGYPVNNGLLSVTIISPKSVDGDALSTTCFALGLENGMKLIESLSDTYAIFITDDYVLHLSPGLEAAFEIEY